MLKQHLARMRTEYERITPPDGFAFALERTLAREKKCTTHSFRWMWRMGGSLVTAMLMLTIATNANAAAADALAAVPVIGAFTRLVTFRSFDAQGEMAQAHIRTPHVEGLGDAELERTLNEQFDAYADALIAQYQADLTEAGATGSIDSDYAVVRDDARLLSVRIDTVVTGASAQQMKRYYTVDKQTGRILTLSNLFRSGSDYIGALSEEVKRQMRARMAADPAQSYFLDEDMTDVFTQIATEQQFYVDEQGALVLSFDEYAVAPGSMGAVRFTIPTETIARMLAPGAPVH